MSASPADGTPGRTPNGSLPPLMRRPKAADPLVRPKDKNRRRPYRPTTNSSGAPNGAGSGNHVNGGLTVSSQGKNQVMAQHPPRSSVTDVYRDSKTILDGTGATQSGFTAPMAPYTDFPLVLTKRSLMEGLRHHVARFYSKKNIDPRNEEIFTRPVRLHRRDPRAPAGGAGSKDEDTMAGVISKDDSVDDKDREKQQILREQREAEREAEMAQVAPIANTGGQKRLGSSIKKTQQVYRHDQTEEKKAGTKLRYEEALPWHLEDFDNKQTWVGSYEAALSETYAQLVQKDGKFYVTPVEKWYKFTTKAPFSTLSIDEAEKRMERKVKDPRWFMESLQANKEKQDEQKNKKATSKLYVGKVSANDDAKIANVAIKREAGEVDELDFEEDRFADDEEGQLIEGDDEDTKEAEQRIKKDQLQANVFDLKDEKGYEKAELLEKKLKEAEKKDGKRVRKALMKREKKFVYDTDSENPYSTESESSDTEAERLKEEQIKKEAEEKKDVPSPNDKAKPPSGASSRGTNTPSGRPSKHPDLSQRSISSTSLKRPGSPNLSEASGNESSRKKLKKKNSTSATLGTGIYTPNGPPSRPRTPNPPPPSSATEATTTRILQPQPQRKASSIKLNVGLDNKRPRTGAGSGSDGEGAGSGGEMSDGTRKRIKIKFTSTNPPSKNPSPGNSRAASPDRNGPSSAPATAGGNRAGSPKVPIPLPTPAELKARIPAEGTTIGELLKVFRGAVDGPERKAKFTEMLRTVSRYESATKLLKPV